MDSCIMHLPAELLCQLLAPWLLFQDMLLLEVACRETHRGFRRLMRTPQVSKMLTVNVFTNFFKVYYFNSDIIEDYPSLSMLDWIRHYTVMDEGTICVTDALLHALASPTAVPTDPYCLVKRIVFSVGSAESLAMFVAVCPVHFPRVEGLRFRVSASMLTSSFGDDLLHALNALASQWVLAEVYVSSKLPERGYHVATPGQVDQMLALIVKLGSTLRVFDLLYFMNLPVSVLAQLSQHCPNCESMLSAGFYDASVSNAVYLQYCARLRKTRSIYITQRDATLTDALLISALSELVNIKSLSIDKASVGCTLASVVAALKLCPSILYIDYHDWLSIYNYGSVGITPSNDLCIRLQSLQETPLQLGELREHLPTIHSLLPAPISLTLVWNSTYATQQAACLSGCLESTKTSVGVTKLHIDCQVAQLSDVTLLTSRLGYLQELSLSDLHAVAFGQSFAAFVEELRQACPQLSWLSLGQPCAMEDGDVSVLVAQLSSLRSLSILPADAASHRLTRAVLSVLGSAGKVWDRLEVRHVCSARDVLEVVGQLQHGLRARNLAFTSCVGGRQYQFKSWVATAEDVERVCKQELEEQRQSVAVCGELT